MVVVLVVQHAATRPKVPHSPLGHVGEKPCAAEDIALSSDTEGSVRGAGKEHVKARGGAAGKSAVVRSHAVMRVHTHLRCATRASEHEREDTLRVVAPCGEMRPVCPSERLVELATCCLQDIERGM